MIKDIRYNEIEKRNGEVLSYLNRKPIKPTVIDVGASIKPWGGDFFPSDNFTIEIYNNLLDTK